jgi:hypothetical protein
LLQALIFNSRAAHKQANRRLQWLLRLLLKISVDSLNKEAALGRVVETGHRWESFFQSSEHLRCCQDEEDWLVEDADEDTVNGRWQLVHWAAAWVQVNYLISLEDAVKHIVCSRDEMNIVQLGMIVDRLLHPSDQSKIVSLLAGHCEARAFEDQSAIQNSIGWRCGLRSIRSSTHTNQIDLALANHLLKAISESTGVKIVFEPSVALTRGCPSPQSLSRSLRLAIGRWSRSAMLQEPVDSSGELLGNCPLGIVSDERRHSLTRADDERCEIVIPKKNIQLWRLALVFIRSGGQVSLKELIRCWHSSIGRRQEKPKRDTVCKRVSELRRWFVRLDFEISAFDHGVWTTRDLRKSQLMA